MSGEGQDSQPNAAEVRYKGTAVSPGLAIGPVVYLDADEHVVRKRRIRPEDISAEWGRFENALSNARTEVQAIRNRVAADVGEGDASIFDAHLLLLEDVSVIQTVKDQVQSRLCNVEFAYEQVVRSYVRKMRELDDDYFRERAGDFMDVSRRVLRNLQGIATKVADEIEFPSILLAKDLAPSQTAGLNRNHVLGIATEMGSRTSHSAIMSRSLKIPSIVGLKGLLGNIEAGTEILLDGYEGVIIVNPSEVTKDEYTRLDRVHHQIDEDLHQLREIHPTTKDQRRIIVSANVEVLEDLPSMEANGAEGIGLLRTEYLFLNQDAFPTEEQQTHMYREMAKASKPYHLIIRTLDIGGDKKRPSLGIEQEVNPFLGYRGIRYCLGRQDMFKTQLRAICRASEEGNVRVMFPMISDVGEVKAAIDLLHQVQDEMRAEGQLVSSHLETGVMIEVPSAALCADIIAPHVDFFSIGSNDLIQYTLAIDRGNEKVANLYQPAHPAILRLIQGVVEAAHKNHIWVGVCGEMASDVTLVPILIGLGIDELSAGATAIPRLKRAIQTLNFAECRELAARQVNRSDVAENVKELGELARRLYSEILL